MSRSFGPKVRLALWPNLVSPRQWTATFQTGGTSTWAVPPCHCLWGASPPTPLLLPIVGCVWLWSYGRTQISGWSHHIGCNSSRMSMKPCAAPLAMAKRRHGETRWSDDGSRTKLWPTFQTLRPLPVNEFPSLRWWWRRPPVVIPLSGRVPGRACGPSRSHVNDGGGLQYVFWKIDRALRVFSPRRIYRRKGSVRRWAR
jgi:hypothetical protein